MNLSILQLLVTAAVSIAGAVYWGRLSRIADFADEIISIYAPGMIVRECARYAGILRRSLGGSGRD